MDVEEVNMRYRELVVVLWDMIHKYVHVSIANIDMVLELFEMASRITNELADNAGSIGGDPVLSQFLNRIVHQSVPDVKSYLQTMTYEILNGIPSSTAQDLVAYEQTTQAAIAGVLASKAAQPDAHEEERKNTVAAMKVYPSGKGLSGVFGMKKAKRIIRQSIILPVHLPGLFNGGRRPWGSIFLYGPPGTGKTRLAEATAAEIGAAFYSISSSTLLSSWFGESEKMVRDIFVHVRGCGEKCVVFVDEIDGICRKRAANDGESSRRLKAELLAQMQDLPRSTFLIAATNCPWDVDPAFMRRFQRRVYVPLPDMEARQEIILDAVDSCETNLSAEDWHRVGELTDGYSGSDLTCLTQSALMMPITELDDATAWVVRKADGKWIAVDDSQHKGPRIRVRLDNVPPDRVAVRDVELRDFLAAIADTSKTVSAEDINGYLEFNTKYA